MGFFSAIRHAEPGLIHNILRYIEHPLALNTLSDMQREGLLSWEEYNACWYTLWRQRVLTSPYLPSVDFGRAYALAMCATTLYDDTFQPRQTGATLGHITRELVTWRQFYTPAPVEHSGCQHSETTDQRILSSLTGNEYFSYFLRLRVLH